MQTKESISSKYSPRWNSRSFYKNLVNLSMCRAGIFQRWNKSDMWKGPLMYHAKDKIIPRSRNINNSSISVIVWVSVVDERDYR